MRRAVVGSLLLIVGLAACADDVLVVDDDVPAAPRALEASYYAGVVTVSWELAPAWNDEAFRVYSRRVSDPDFFFIAEVTSCIDGLCSYQDTNVLGGETYVYIVSAVSPNSGIETDAAVSVEVAVPMPTPAPVPDGPWVVALDNATYLTWGVASRAADDFSHYKVYQDLDGSSFLLGETDSEGFVDLLAANGETYGYFVTSVDVDGHESAGSVVAVGTPRPDYHGDFLYDDADRPDLSGFRFVGDEVTNPRYSGTDPDRHFRLESDTNGWWLVAGPGTSIYQGGIETTSLRCGVAADGRCTDVVTAPTTNYGTADVQIFTEQSYVFRVIGDDGEIHYGVIRIDLLGVDQAGDGIMIFDWAYQLQAGNPDLVEGVND